MELFERVRLLKRYSGSLDKLAQAMDLAPQRLSSYSNDKSQINLYKYLPKLLKAFPNIRREWLYFEEGPMLKTEGESEITSIDALRAQIMELTEANRRLAETNQRLVNELLDNNRQGKE